MRKQRKLSRRRFLQFAAAGAGAFAYQKAATATPRLSFAPAIRSDKFSDRMIILGMDGVDPELLRRFIDEGHLPTFKKMMEQGLFHKIRTTNPPHSPVAWSSFITGANPGQHGIFDFVHRDAHSFTPYMSTSRSFDSNSHLDLGKWRVPFGSGRVELMRRGVPFWDVLESAGIPATVCQIPANFPITPTSTKAISGMGTPDLLGSYGTFSYFTDKAGVEAPKFAGGSITKIRLNQNKYEGKLIGPSNAFRSDGSNVTVPFNVLRDITEPIIKFNIGENEIILKQGEWSEWLPINFEYVPYFASSSGMVRVYLKQARPDFELYISPINVDPLDAGLPISSPPEYARDLAEAIGRFHTQGFPADTKALSHGVFSSEEFFHQAKIVLDESLRLFDYQLNQFDDGAFYFYFSSIDQCSHMLLRNMQPDHPLYEPNASYEVKNALVYLYKRMDEVLAQALSKVDSRTTLMALSDHGFNSFTREFNANTWLLENGYVVLKDRKKQEDCDFYSEVDWSKTKAYGLGLNGIYINLQGREPNGWVSAAESDALRKEIASKLVEARDPIGGAKILNAVYDSRQIYNGPWATLAPDLVLGYAPGYRIADESVLGKFPRDAVANRTDKWASDHCVDPSVVPGMLFCTKGLKVEDPALWDMAPSILNLFGQKAPPSMDGRVVF